MRRLTRPAPSPGRLSKDTAARPKPSPTTHPCVPGGCAPLSRQRTRGRTGWGTGCGRIASGSTAKRPIACHRLLVCSVIASSPAGAGRGDRRERLRTEHGGCHRAGCPASDSVSTCWVDVATTRRLDSPMVSDIECPSVCVECAVLSVVSRVSRPCGHRARRRFRLREGSRQGSAGRMIGTSIPVSWGGTDMKSRLIVLGIGTSVGGASGMGADRQR